MKYVILSFLFFGCKFHVFQNTTITLQWEGIQNKPLPAIVFTNIDNYVEKEIEYIKLLQVRNKVMNELTQNILQIKHDYNLNFPLKVTLQQGYNKRIYYFSKEKIYKLLIDFEKILDKSNLNFQKNELIYIRNVLYPP